MKIRIERTYYSDVTIGNAIVLDDCGGVFQFYTCELPWLENQRRVSCIPEGEYDCIKHQSPKFGECFWIQEVPNRSEILIHVGNTVDDLLGCIAPGINKSKKGVWQSRNAINKLIELMPDFFKVEIIEFKENFRKI